MTDEFVKNTELCRKVFPFHIFFQVLVHAMCRIHSQSNSVERQYFQCDLKQLLFLLDPTQLSEGRTVYRVTSPEETD